jgi:HSP20 family molecular chaperone IbpA
MADMSGQSRGPGDRGAESTRNVPVYLPPAEIYETAEALVLTLEMPGVDADAVNITLEKRVLTVTGRSRHAPPEGYTLMHGEFRDGDYERSFTLSEAIDGERIEAAMTDGVLRITLPKARPAPAKTIQVKVD